MPKDSHLTWKAIRSQILQTLWQATIIHCATLVSAYLLLAPLTIWAWQRLLRASDPGGPSGPEILSFLLTAPGLFTLFLWGALTLALLVLQQAALLAINQASARRTPLPVGQALLFALSHGTRILLFTAHLGGRLLCLTLPFIGIGLALAWILFRGDDQDYYHHIPQDVLWVALLSMTLVLLTMMSVLLRNLSGWLLSLPLVLFHGEKPGRSFTTSEQNSRTSNKTSRKTLWIWALGSLLLAVFLVTAIVQAPLLIALCPYDLGRFSQESMDVIHRAYRFIIFLAGGLIPGSLATVLFLYSNHCPPSIGSEHLSRTPHHTHRESICT